MSSKFESKTEEDENLRSQALDQFREWIAKHPKIKKCKTDDKFLLRFLRTKKFSIPGACELLENYLTLRKTLPHLFNHLDVVRPDFETFFGFNACLVLQEMDLKGRLVFYTDISKLDPKKCSAVDILRIGNMYLESVSLDERSQINGIVQVVNGSDLKLSFLSLWTPAIVKEFAECWQKAFPIRYPKIYYVNIPTFARSLLQLLLSFASEKLKSRVSIANGWDEVFEELGSSIFPEEIGGKVPISELGEYTKKFVTQCREEVLDLISDIDIEVSETKVNFGNSYDADLDAAIVGSFRKISVD